MKVVSIFAAHALALSIVLVPSTAIEAAEYGSIVHDGVTMQVEGVVAVWNGEKKQLKFHLFPFEPTDEEIEMTRRGREHRIERELVDEETWPSWNPRGHYSVSWFDPEQIGDHDTSTVFIYAYGVGGQNENVNLNYMMEFAEGGLEGSLEGDVAPGEQIRLVASGEDSDYGMTWDLDITTEIFSALPKE